MQMSQNRLDDGRLIKTHIVFLLSLLKDTPYRILRLVSISSLLFWDASACRDELTAEVLKIIGGAWGEGDKC